MHKHINSAMSFKIFKTIVASVLKLIKLDMSYVMFWKNEVAPEHKHIKLEMLHDISCQRRSTLEKSVDQRKLEKLKVLSTNDKCEEDQMGRNRL